MTTKLLCTKTELENKKQQITEREKREADFKESQRIYYARLDRQRRLAADAKHATKRFV